MLRECDLVIEAIAERMDWKHDLYKKVAPHIGRARDFREQHVGPVDQRTRASVSGELRQRFCGVHFFNPPRYMHLVELIPTATTRSRDARSSSKRSWSPRSAKA